MYDVFYYELDTGCLLFQLARSVDLATATQTFETNRQLKPTIILPAGFSKPGQTLRAFDENKDRVGQILRTAEHAITFTLNHIRTHAPAARVMGFGTGCFEHLTNAYATFHLADEDTVRELFSNIKHPPGPGPRIRELVAQLKDDASHPATSNREKMRKIAAELEGLTITL